MVAEGFSLPVFDFTSEPEAILKACKQFRDTRPPSSLPNTNFLKGAKWSPDGACLLTATEDNSLHVFDLPEDALERCSLGSSAERDTLSNAGDTGPPALVVGEGESIYDYAWFPAMQASDPVSCVFASTSRAHPIHMWDACSGELRCTYRAYDAADEVTAATSLAFSLDGARLYGGFNKTIRVWDTSRPGRDYQEVVTHQKKADGLPGIISCMAFNPDRSSLMAAGSYSGQAGLYDPSTNELLYVLQGQKGGLTQVRFGPDGNFLFTGARADSEVWCWDVRYQSGTLYKLKRDTAATNQRIGFDIEPCGKHLASGGQDGGVRVYDLAAGEEVARFQASTDTVNGFEFHPFLPFAATASGQRRFMDVSHPSTESDSDSESANDAGGTVLGGLDNNLTIWRFRHTWMTISGSTDLPGLDHAQDMED